MNPKKTEYNHHNYDEINKFFDYQDRNREYYIHDTRAEVFYKYAKVMLIVFLAIGLLYLLIQMALWFKSSKSTLPTQAIIQTNKDIIIDRALINGVKDVHITNTLLSTKNKNGLSGDNINEKANAYNNESITLEGITSEAFNESGNLLKDFMKPKEAFLQNNKEQNTAINTVNVNVSNASNKVIANNTSSDIKYQCNSLIQSGDNKPKVLHMDLKNSKGKINFNYETYEAKDLIRVIYEKKVLFDTGCVGTKGWKKKVINYNGKSKKIEIHVLPNCLGTEPQTKWEIKSFCK